MAYIGNTVNNQGFAPAIDYFSGNGSTVTFTLSRPVASVAQMIVAIDNVIQNPSTAFSVTGNAITFTSAPLSGSNNIWVEYTSLITTYNAISQDPSVIGDITASGGFLSTGDFGNTYTDGTIVDYVTGMARITTGPADGMTFYNGGTASRTALMTLNSSGNMGVGVTPSAWQSGSAIQMQDNVSYSRYGYGRNVYFNGSNFVYNTTGVATQYLQAAGAHQFFYATSGTAGATATLTEAMRIDSSGNVGIGTASPTVRLQLQTATTGNVTAATWSDGVTDTGYLGIRSGGGIGVWAGGFLAFGSGSGTFTERMRIDSSGNLLVNTTSSTLYRGNRAYLNVNAVGTTACAGSFVNSQAGAQTISVWNQGDSGTRYLLEFSSNSVAATVGQITTNGTSTTYGTSSDYRLKENIAPMQNALNVVQQLKPVTYNWKSDGSSGQGFIAHELQAVVPDCVTGEKDAVDEEGKPVYQGIDTSFLVATLTAAIQELKAEFDAYKASNP